MARKGLASIESQQKLTIMATVDQAEDTRMAWIQSLFYGGSSPSGHKQTQKHTHTTGRRNLHSTNLWHTHCWAEILGSQDEYPIEAPLKEGSTCVAPFRFPHGTLIASSHLPFMVGTVLSTILQMGLFPQGHTVSDGDEVWLLACLRPKPLVILNR